MTDPRAHVLQAADLVAHILKNNGFPAGKADFAAADAVNSQIAWPAGRGVGAGSAPASTWYAPTGNLAQLMRGVFFHNSNLIFSSRRWRRPTCRRSRPTSRPDGLTTFDWGLMIYTGWRAVEQSATALADASSLMMLPGLRCENGRAAPVTEPDWIRFTDRMISVARRTYRLAQTKNKEAVSEYTTRSLECLQRVSSDVSRRRRPRPRRCGEHLRPLHAPLIHFEVSAKILRVPDQGRFNHVSLLQ